MRRVVDPRFPRRMRELLDQRGMSLRALAAHTYYSKSYPGELVTGVKAPTADVARRVDEALGAGGKLVALVQPIAVTSVDEGEMDALDLARRVASSDLSVDTLDRLESVVDDIACGYATTPPEELLPRARRHLAYVGQLVAWHGRLTREFLLVNGVCRTRGVGWCHASTAGLGCCSGGASHCPGGFAADSGPGEPVLRPAAVGGRCVVHGPGR